MNLFRLPVIVGTIPNNIQNGQVEDAVPVMANFNWIINQVNANAAPLATAALLNAANTFTMVQSGPAATNPANFPIASQVQNRVFSTLSSTFGTNSLTSRISALPLTAYAVGQMFTFIPAQTNTAVANINIDSVGQIPISKYGLGSIAASDLVRNRTAIIVHNGSTMELLNPQPKQTRSVLTSGTTYTTPVGASRLVIRMWGGGGAGGGSAAAGGNGGATTFNSIAASGATGGNGNGSNTGGSGGTGGAGSGTPRISGGDGSPGGEGGLGANVGGNGAPGPYGGAGKGGNGAGNTGGDAAANSGAGGGGWGGGAASAVAGGGGGGGEYVELIINAPIASYAYAIGAAGAPAGGGSQGGSGGAGQIVIDEFY